jgi:hypothetical protein
LTLARKGPGGYPGPFVRGLRPLRLDRAARNTPGPSVRALRPYAVNFLLFAATLATTLAAGGPVFCASLMAILASHEMGHWLAARRHGVDTSLPYFLPMPFGPVGTMGAFIRIRSSIPTRAAVLDIGAAGPLAGFLVAFPLLLAGYALAEPVQVPAMHPNAWQQSPWSMARALFAAGKEVLPALGLPESAEALGPWLRSLAFAVAHHPSLQSTPSETLVMGDSLVTLLVTRLTHGPLPPGTDLRVDGMATAAWFGMLVTTLNMMPVGQLDGGHVVYALLGRRAETVARVFLWVLLGLGVFASWNWLVWFVVVRFVVGVRHPPATVELPLSPRRRAVALLSLAVLALTFVPVPFSL